jgi:hypothetical protein
MKIHYKICSLSKYFTADLQKKEEYLIEYREPHQCHGNKVSKIKLKTLAASGDLIIMS